jgi:hypothetical protein
MPTTTPADPANPEFYGVHATAWSASKPLSDAAHAEEAARLLLADAPLLVRTGAIETIIDGCRRHNIVPGIHSAVPLAQKRHEQGFRMITVSADHSALVAGMRAESGKARGAVTGTGSGTQPPAGKRDPYSA